MDRIEILNGYYAIKNEDERLTSKIGSVEFLTTIKYIEKYLQKGMKILEIGAGTGRYSHHLAKQGYEVDAIELTDHNIEIFKSHITKDEKISIIKGDAVDLSSIETGKYDITLLLGPMYHLYTEKDKISALSEAIRVTKKGGIVFVAYTVSDSTILQHGFIKGKIKSLIEEGLLNTDDFKPHSEPKEVFELYRKEEIDALMSIFNVTRLHYVGTDMASYYMRDTINNMDDETFDLYLKYHLFICERHDLVGMTNHSLDVFRKE